MRILVVYESMFGATRHVAEAIAAGAGEQGEVTLRTVNDVSPEELRDTDVLVLGGPTHAHGMSRPESRLQAERWAQDEARHLSLEPGAADGTGIRELLQGMTAAPHHAATFDTRASMPEMFTGSAARRAAKRLRRLGATMLVEPESFVVDSASALIEGEEDRAKRYGTAIGAAAASLQHAPA